MGQTLQISMYFREENHLYVLLRISKLTIESIKTDIFRQKCTALHITSPLNKSEDVPKNHYILPTFRSLARTFWEYRDSPVRDDVMLGICVLPNLSTHISAVLDNTFFNNICCIYYLFFCFAKVWSNVKIKPSYVILMHLC